MTVFKGYLRIVRANLGQLLMYVGIFLAICVAISRSNPGGTPESFTQKKLHAAVIARDGGYWLFQKVRRNGCSPGRRMALYSV